MKNRIPKLFGMGLTIAIIASLFIMGASVGATKQYDFSILMDMSTRVYTPTPPGYSTSEWIGGPYEATLPYDGGTITKPLDGKAYVTHYLATYAYQLYPAGTFGGGTAVMVLTSVVDDYVAAHRVVNAVWEITLDDDPENDPWEGTFTCSRTITRPITGWASDDPASFAVTTLPASDPGSLGVWTFIYGTGDFETFHFSTTAWGAAGDGSIDGIGSFNGSQIYCDKQPGNGNEHGLKKGEGHAKH